MAKDTVSLALEGEVSLEQFAVAVQRFQELIRSLSREVIPDRPSQARWVIDFLDAGSAALAARGVGGRPGEVEAVIDAVDLLASAAELQRPLPFSEATHVKVEQLTALLNGAISELRLGAADKSYVITAPDSQNIPPMVGSNLPMETIGAVTGRVETLAHRTMRFSLYELLEDKRVDCFLRQGQEPLVANVWGKLAVVEGLVKRDARSGKPVSVRDISAVQSFDDPEPGRWRSSAGIAPGPITPTPEDTIRRMRDDE
jgi:hypothetical protein